MYTDWGLGVLCRLVALTSTHTYTGSQSGLVLTHTHIQPGALGERGKQSCISIEIVAAEKRAFDVLTWCFGGK